MHVPTGGKEKMGLNGGSGVVFSCWSVAIAVSVVTCPVDASPTSSVMSVRKSASRPILLPLRNGAVSAFAASEQGEPSAEIAIVTVLLTVAPSVRT